MMAVEKRATSGMFRDAARFINALSRAVLYLRRVTINRRSTDRLLWFTPCQST